jgi:hypothetical protein
MEKKVSPVFCGKCLFYESYTSSPPWYNFIQNCKNKNAHIHIITPIREEIVHGCYEINKNNDCKHFVDKDTIEK